MMFARDKSQMCNNLLQYAHVYAWGREHGRKVISMRFSYKYQYFKICHTSLTGFGWYLLAKYMAALKLLPTASFKYRDCNREALERKMLKHRHIVVSGWFARWYDLFLKYRDGYATSLHWMNNIRHLSRQRCKKQKPPLLSPLPSHRFALVSTYVVATMHSGVTDSISSMMRYMQHILTSLQRCIQTRLFMSISRRMTVR